MFSSLRFSTATLMVVVVLLALGTIANAQTITGSISGAVTDANGGMIPERKRHAHQREDRSSTRLHY